MIYVFSGNDTDKKIKARDKVIENFKDREVITISEDNFSKDQFQGLVSGGDIFAKNHVVVLNYTLGGSNNSFVMDSLQKMHLSENVFLLIEEDLPKPTREILKKIVKDFEIFDLEEKTGQKFNIFSITDAFSARDKKNTWVLMQKALRNNISAEEILNILIWQSKNLLNVYNSLSVSDSGLAPFVYNKSKSYSKNFKKEELENIAEELVKLFHESHLGLELEPNLEKFLLKTL